MFSIDHNRLIRINLAAFLRKTIQIKWITLLISEVEILYNRFISLRAQTIYNAAHDGSIISLEHILNAIFDPVQKRIFIDDGSLKINAYIYNRAELMPGLFIYNKSENHPGPYIFNDNEISGDLRIDFQVVMPTGISFSMNYLKSIVNRYRIAGKNYKIGQMTIDNTIITVDSEITIDNG